MALRAVVGPLVTVVVGLVVLHVGYEARFAVHVVVHLLHCAVRKVHVEGAVDALPVPRLLLAVAVAIVVLHAVVVLVLRVVPVPFVVILQGEEGSLEGGLVKWRWTEQWCGRGNDLQGIYYSWSSVMFFSVALHGPEC